MTANIHSGPTTADQEQPPVPEMIIRVNEVTRVYPVGESEVMALRDAALEVPKGVLGALKGRSGSGKTTLLNIIGGLDRPTLGEVYLFGQPLSRLSKSELTELRRHRIGFVFQSFAIMPMFSAVENVELMLRIAGYTQNRRKLAMRALEIVGLGPWANHRGSRAAARSRDDHPGKRSYPGLPGRRERGDGAAQCGP